MSPEPSLSDCAATMEPSWSQTLPVPRSPSRARSPVFRVFASSRRTSGTLNVSSVPCRATVAPPGAGR
eukprot:2914749-Prymnesium_polylepis.1